MSDLEELRRLSEAATPGPWSVDAFYRGSGGGDMVRGVTDAIVVDYSARDTDAEDEADAAFIAAAVNLVRDLLSNPTSSVSTEGVADLDRIIEKALRWKDEGFYAGTEWAAVAATLFVHDVRSMNPRERDRAIRIGQQFVARLTAINPDSPVEPDRG